MTKTKKSANLSKGKYRNPTIKVKPHTYQPKKAELEDDMNIPASPKELARVVLRKVDVEEIKDKK